MCELAGFREVWGSTRFWGPRQIDSKDNIAKLEHAGFCVLKGVFSRSLIDAAREAFWPILTNYLSANRENPNRGPHRHFLAAPFRSPIFSSEFFFDRRVLEIVQSTLGETAVADQWGCDAPVAGSQYQNAHVDYQRPCLRNSLTWRCPLTCW